MVKQVDGRTREIQGILGDVKKSTPDLPDLVHQTRETVEDADQIVTGLQNYWLIQRLISPSRKDGPIKIDGFVKSLLKRHPGESRGSEHLEITGFRLSPE